MSLPNPIYTGGAAVYGLAMERELKRTFTWKDRFGEEYLAYHKSGSMIHVPREVCPLGIEDRRADGLPVEFDLDYEPRDDDQRRYVQEGLDLIDEGRSFIAQADTGFGKTACAMPWIERVGRKTAIVVPKEDLVRQWRKRLAQFLPGVHIGHLQANKVQVVNKDIVICMMHSVGIPDRYSADIMNQFGLVIFDEVHRIAASQFSHAFMAFPAKIRIGLSATPKRSDGRLKLIKAHLGGIGPLAQVMPMMPKVYRYQIENRAIAEVRHSNTENGHVLKILSRTRFRNKLIRDSVRTCFKKQRKTVVFSFSTAHLELLRDMLLGGGITEDHIGFYVRSLEDKKRTKGELAEASKRPIVLATYGMMREGTDFPWLDACVLASPISGSVAQAAGRVVRKHPGKKQPIIIDIVDLSSNVFTGWAVTRDKWYKEKGAEIVEVDE